MNASAKSKLPRSPMNGPNFSGNKIDRILVTGGTGFLGRLSLPTLANAINKEAQIISVARRELPINRHNVISLRADLSRLELYEEALRSVDYVLWMAADRRHNASLSELWPVNVQPLIEAVSLLKAEGKLRRFIYVSSVSALDQADYPSLVLDDQSLPSPRTEYGRSKLLAEQVVLNSGLPSIVLRLPFLYGPGYSNSSFLRYYDHIAQNKLLGRLQHTARLSLLFGSDLGSIAATLIDNNGDYPSDVTPYLISDGHVYSVNSLITHVAMLREHLRPRPLPRVASTLINATLAVGPLSYWRHAAFDKNFFVVNSSRFNSRCPDISYMDLNTGLKQTYSTV